MDSNFRTVLTPTKSDIEINHQDKILCIGSCFAQHIGQRLFDNKFSTLVNPFGIVYNPISVVECLDILLRPDFVFSENDDKIFHNERGWHSYLHHGSFSHSNQSLFFEKINNSLSEGKSFLKNATKLILTFGTSNVFVHKFSNAIVANCHKVPQQEFTRRRLSVDETFENLTMVLQKIKKAYPHLEVIVTVSPIRHIKDGLVENQRNKSVLVLALDKLEKEFDNVHYFPSYELLLDDLRDYRFYKKDMIHPSDVAVDYIWNFFGKTWFSEPTIELNQQIKKITLAASHRPLEPDSSAHLEFVKKQLVLIEKMEKEYDFLSFEKEKKTYLQFL